jgi:hypothetical protein
MCALAHDSVELMPMFTMIKVAANMRIDFSDFTGSNLIEFDILLSFSLRTFSSHTNIHFFLLT